MNFVCGCGYDFANPTGKDGDTARCNECPWAAGGIGADHAAYHHHQSTGHAWTLLMEKT